MARGYRYDIQALRAIAVFAVIAFHVWPDTFPGGFVGVDVFFVISGFLITGQLIKTYESTGTVSVVDFYGRRIRRLLPASTLVLVTVSVLTIAMLPATQWRGTAIGVFSSAIYLENWDLIHKSANYLNAWFAPNAVQHFWSLSIEEQFYFVWPLLLLTNARLATQRGPTHFFRFGMWGACLIAAASFAYSVYSGAAAPTQSYFSTFSRLWELAIGACLAFRAQAPANKTLQFALTSIGLLSIALSALILNSAMPYPSWRALFPTLGCATIIFAGLERGAIQRVLAFGPVQYIGGLSYSLYLWHWPIIVFFQYFFGPGLSGYRGCSVILLSLVLSHLTKYTIEDPLHFPKTPTSPRTLSFRLGAICMAMALCAAALTFGDFQLKRRMVRVDHPDPQIYVGAQALVGSAKPAVQSRLVPSVLDARLDRASVMTDGCMNDYPGVIDKPCVYTRGRGDVHVLVVGDSHAMQWVPTLMASDTFANATIEVYGKGSCPFMRGIIYSNILSRPYTECTEWNSRVRRRIAGQRFDFAFTAAIRGYLVDKGSQATMVDAFRGSLAALTAVATHVIVIADNSHMRADLLDCVSYGGDYQSRCSVPSAEAFDGKDDLVEAARQVVGTAVLDLNAAICRPGVCRPAEGNVLIYQDLNHITATYVKTIAPYFDREMHRMVPGGD